MALRNCLSQSNSLKMASNSNKKSPVMGLYFMLLSITSAVKSKKITANTVDDICSLLCKANITGVQINKRMDNRTMRLTNPPQ